MKKMMIVLASIALGLSIHAAQVTWKTGPSIKAPTSATDGAYGTANVASKTLAMYVWLVSKETYDATAISGIYSAYGSKLAEATAYKTEASGSLGATVVTKDLGYSTTEDTTYYALVLSMYDDGNGVTGYIENKATATINTAGSDAVIGNLAKFVGGDTSGIAITGWSGISETTDVPEPTSGLLLIIGGALLALRRKQK